ncbi:MAG TPA: 16S rRNA (guanine(966)-N(2))-methyltransferase RsmD [Acidobacteriaceae bacterium]|jgi:16S rRNA (guanine(966)-N(2))-methyltransferase RsmD
MRVIAGTYRSRPIAAPAGASTRPTSDRLRETLFNVLAPKVEGARFADLFAGSGAVGIEALSRGAGHVSFVENANPAIATIRANLASLKIVTGFRIDTRGVPAALRDFSGPRPPEPWDLIFLDPPYHADQAYANTLTNLGRLGAAILTPSGTVIVEHQRKSLRPIADIYGSLHRTRVLEQGDAALSFYQLSKPA